jgi:hypothetical protein
MMYVMKKRLMKLRTSLLMAGLSLALMSQPAIAQGKKWVYNEESWKDIKAYGRVVISEDSAREWGPWTEFVQPAAGAIPLVVLPEIHTEADGAQYFRPESADEYSKKYTEPVVAQPPTGAWYGYSVYERYYERYDYDEEGGYKNEYYGPYPGKIALRLIPDDPNTVTVDGGDGEGTVSYTMTDLEGNPVHQSGDIPANFDDGLPEFEAEKSDESSYDEINGYPVYPPVTRQVTAGWGGWGSYGNYEYDDYNFWFVAGIPTPLTDIANLQAGNVTADYYGRSFDSWTPVHIEVKFLPGTWSGSWNGGVDGGTWTYTDDSGTKYVRGDVGFNAGGTINGANIQSTSLSAEDGTVSGQVQGSFFGSNADALGGVVDITKTTEAYENARHVDLFITCKGTECVPYD